MEFIFFIVALMVLCFEFVTKTVLMSMGHQHIKTPMSYCWTQNQELFFLPFCPHIRYAGGAQEAGRGHRQDNRPILTKRISYTIRHAHHKSSRMRRKKEYLWLCCLSSQATVMCAKARLSGKWLNICLSTGSNEWTFYFAFIHLLTVFTIKTRFFPSSLLILSPALLLEEVSKQLGGVLFARQGQTIKMK